MNERARDWPAICALAAAWVALLALAGPSGNFPLNDDWGPAGSVEHLLHTGRYLPSGWMDMNLIAQVLWGALFCLPRGFSFEALRLSTQVLGLAGVLATFALSRECGAPRRVALLCGALVAVNPIWFELSNTYMTDVPFAAFSTIAVWLLARSSRTRSPAEVVAGFCATLLALLVRQNALALPAAFLAAVVLRERKRPAAVAGAVLLVVACAAVQSGFAAWLVATRPAASVAHYGRIAGGLLSVLRGAPLLVCPACNFADLAIYLGLFAFPLAVALEGTRLSGLPRQERIAEGAAWAIAAAAILAIVNYFGERLPLLRNTFIDVGVGPLTLRDCFGRSQPQHWPQAPAWCWTLATVAGALGALWAAAALVRGARRGALFPVLALLALAGPLVLVNVFDRYVLPLLPLLLAAAAGTLVPRRGPLVVGALAAALFGVYSTAATHDYLAWNRARWQALGGLLAQGHRPEEIDGGVEFNGRYLYSPDYLPVAGKSWWWVEDDALLLAFGPMPGREEIARVPFRRWLPPGEGAVLVLRRSAAR